MREAFGNSIVRDFNAERFQHSNGIEHGIGILYLAVACQLVVDYSEILGREPQFSACQV